MNPVNEHENADLPEKASGGGELDSYQFSALSEKTRPDQSANLGFILDIPLEVSVELGRTQMLVNDLLKLGQGSVIELSKLAGETLEILANQKLVARGEVVVINEKYGIRVTEIISPMERVEQLR
ncbi:MAG: flagellar motor switch protein FliN [Desulfobacterales bacterium]|nr:flagellar motor switch protein FliN [Desulfobacterales bacterium]MDJ0855119.1 flagellar motor switch protein FliN [Desulfobacterales bacterium]MDJ0886225.1 flagellar motor switch protein FliN [Desulfobacterales bacterium]MDJ0990385.1 flagellar motor switch protein FliN [Desulfobacterales bacterium]